ncbi:FtsW/RodA/SpoVE family cell cycle protein [Prosthecobacter dejongeii]|uniref:Rod shape determining protein RodA n=1 Tax=Prosthecobacter dejongeii TaxID=48465 RepID=A0A7W8DRP9_9BACT|nr:FtsW/RodA/SpoVE family cell cycle protein [Prosthecobacter dejongeii]MBB5040114.1 rod shape determining protein RodA [Prosthecobacter dejongeii]
MTPLFKKFLGINWILILTMLGLLAFGVYAIYNASYFRETGDLALKWKQQMTWIGLGVPFLFTASLIDYKWVRWACWPMYLAGIGGLVYLHFKGIEINGNKNWVIIAGQSIQPSQFAIMSGILMLAVVFGELPRMWPVFRRPWLRIIVGGLLAGIPAAMVIKEDLGSGLVWGPVFLSMMLVGSIPFRYLITLVLGALCVIPLIYFFVLKPYQQARIDTTWYLLTNQMEKVDTRGDGWVPNFVQTAVASAGFEGKGPMSEKVPDQRSIHRNFFPEAEAFSDFIFSVICEEFGFRGAVLLLTGIALLLIQGIFMAFYSRDQVGRLLVVGVVTMFFAHTFQNAGMNLCMLPVIGLPMPFISYGGTFMIVTLFLVGMMQSVWVHRNISPVRKKTVGGREIRDDDDED